MTLYIPYYHNFYGFGIYIYKVMQDTYLQQQYDPGP